MSCILDLTCLGLFGATRSVFYISFLRPGHMSSNHTNIDVARLGGSCLGLSGQGRDCGFEP